jgi:4-carboxymuconolactone decarboxylase
MANVEEGFRLLTIGDPRAVAAMSGAEGATLGLQHLDSRTEALLHLGALIALGAPAPSYWSEVQAALRAGARLEDLLAVLVALAGTVGSARIVSAAPRIALAAGYDVEAALEEIDRAKAPIDPARAPHG